MSDITLTNAEIGTRIRKLRDRIGMTGEELATKIGKTKSTVSKYEMGNIDNIPLDIINTMAKVLFTSPEYIMGWTNDPNPKSNNIKAIEDSRPVKVLGKIPAGSPALAIEDVEGYRQAPVRDPENYFYLRVEGDSMINAGINNGDLVLIRFQPNADDGQIVACRVNGDEATLKRLKRQCDSIVLMPENSKYSPIVVKEKDFVSGEAAVIGVAVEVVHTF